MCSPQVCMKASNTPPPANHQRSRTRGMLSASALVQCFVIPIMKVSQPHVHVFTFKTYDGVTVFAPSQPQANLGAEWVCGKGSIVCRGGDRSAGNGRGCLPIHHSICTNSWLRCAQQSLGGLGFMVRPLEALPTGQFCWKCISTCCDLYTATWTSVSTMM